MRRLILMRHAKSSWDSPALSDHDRPLNDRGQRSATALGEWLRTHGFLPDQALVSSATRTQQTMDRLNVSPAPDLMSRLYHAGPEIMHDALRNAKGTTVLMIGHNPGIAEFAADVLSELPDHPRFDAYPTGATLVADFDIADWSEMTPAIGRARAFVVPRDLVA